MSPTFERKLALFFLACVLIANAAALSAELSVGAVTGTDNISHWALLQGMVKAAEAGANPLDFWSPEGSFGEAPMRTYQPLAHALVALVYFALGKSVPLMTVFLWVRYLSVVLLPVGFYAAARMLELPPFTALASAAMAPLISTNALYGLDYSSYVASGRGLFPQSVATILMLLAIGAGYRAVRFGSSRALAGLLTGLTAICHFIYGWIAAVSIVLVVLLPDEKTPRLKRLGRAIAVGGVALIVSAFQILPVLIDGPILNHSRWEQPWKWDSFGAAAVVKMLLSGELLDHDRLPVLSLLALAGAAGICWSLYRSRRRSNVGQASRPAQYMAGREACPTFVIAGALFWLLVFFGRATWGPLLWLLGATPDLHVHRTIGAVQVFLVLLAAMGLVEVCKLLAERVHVAAAIVAAIAILSPMLYERSQYLARNEARGYQMAGAYAAEQGTVEAVIENVRQTGGRVYAGLGTTWGPKFNIAGIPFFAFLNMALVPQTSASYHILALTSDIIPSFDETRPAEYRLFNIRSVVAPADREAELPKFLAPRGALGRYRLFDAPDGGYFDVVRVTDAVKISKETFYEVNDRWLRSDGPEKKQHLLLSLRGDAMPAQGVGAGAIRDERQRGQEYEAECEMSAPGYVLFKMTWHPKWIAYVDGKPRQTAMLSPGFTGVPLEAGHHDLVMRYEPGMWKVWMALAGLAVALALTAWERTYRRKSSA
jgi:hypothetical protein